MASTGLSAYTLRVRKRYSRGNTLQPMQIGGQCDPWTVIQRHLGEQKGHLKIRDADAGDGQGRPVGARVFRVSKVQNDRDTGAIFGIITTGEYGRSGSIRKAQTGKLMYRKQADEADMAPLYFRIQIPEGGTTGVLVLQRLGLLGLRGILGEEIKKCMAVAGGMTPELGVLVDRDMLKRYIEGGDLTEIRVVARKLESDSRTILRQSTVGGSHLDDGDVFEILFRRKKFARSVLKTIKSIAEGTEQSRRLVHVYGLERPEEVSVTIDLDGQRKTFKLLHPEEIGVTRSLDGQVATNDRSGHPTFESINEFAKDWCDELVREVN